MNNVKTYIEEFSKRICNVTNASDTFNTIDDYFKNNPVYNNGLFGRVWILIGKNKDEKYVSLIVAQSEDIQHEITSDVWAMFNLEHKKQRFSQEKWDWDKEVRYNLDVIHGPQIAKINSNDNKYFYQKNHSKIKNQYLYRYLFKNYRDLQIYEVDIDLYLGINQNIELDTGIKNIYEFGKDYYAESKLAVETKSLFWNYYKSGIGKRAYNYFIKQQ